MATNKTTFKEEVGFVVNAKEYLLSLRGLPSARINDLLQDDKGNNAIVISLEEDTVVALFLSDTPLRAGEKFTLSEKKLQFSVGDHLFGRIINPLGDPIDQKGSLPKDNTELIFDVVAPGVSAREDIRKQFETGMTLVDILYPISKGQRQLLFGPTGSGKTGFIKSIIANQKDKNIVCIYASIGKPSAFVRRLAEDVFAQGAGSYTIILSALADDPTSVISITPSVALLLAEHFSKQGKEVLLILDDLGSHAKYMREISLLMGQIPGRQSYPGDIFYQHAHLIERAGNFNEQSGGGSITLLPMLETDTENFTDLIPTNLMAMTDGHLFFSSTMRAEGYHPPVAIDRSVTRVGKQSQRFIQKELATRIMALLAEYKEQEEYSRFGTNLSNKTKNTLRRGALVQELLKQEQHQNLSQDIQITLLSLVFTSFLAERDRPFLRKNKEVIVDALINNSRLKDVRKKVLSDEVSLDEFLEILDNKSIVLESVCQP